MQSNTSGKLTVVPGHLVTGGTRELHSVTSVLVEELGVVLVVGGVEVVEVVMEVVVEVLEVVVEVVEVVTVTVVVEAVVDVVELQCSSSWQGLSPQSTSWG